MGKILSQTYYERSPIKVAQDLLGCFLIRKRNGKIEKYKIVETEAYNGAKDLACHASHGKTKRNEIMFGPAGFYYVYFTYGLHYLLNIVTGEENDPSAVLIRALEPCGVYAENNVNGPARLTKALGIDKFFYGLPAYEKKYGLWIEERDQELKSSQIKKTTRVGVDYAKEYRDKKWRYYLKNNRFVSKQ